MTFVATIHFRKLQYYMLHAHWYLGVVGVSYCWVYINSLIVALD